MPIQCPIQTHLLHLTPDDLSDPYRLLPFDIADGTSRITVQYTFTPGSQENPQARNVVDLGLFDPRGHEFLTAQGFRGWSGSSRSTVTLTPTEATPGYLPGPLYPGTWHVLLGLYKIAPEGCDVTVEITADGSHPVGALHPADGIHPMEESQAIAPLPSRTIEPFGTVKTGPAWYRGDLHCHTHHSDATGTVADLAAVARAQGLDFVAITDHNTLSYLPELARHSAPDLLLIPGIEISTYRGHANVWGLREWVDFRATRDDDMRRIRERVRELGLPFSINHPKYNGPEWEFETTVEADAVEGWQAPWWFSNYESLAFWNRLLRQGQRIALVGGSDKHQKPFDGTLTPYELGTPTTWVYASNLSERTILDGIGRGHVFVSQGPPGPLVELTARAVGQTAMMGDELCVPAGAEVVLECRIVGGASCAEQGGALRVIHKNGEAQRMPIRSDDFAHAWRITAEMDDYWRIEVIEPTHVPLDKDPVALWAFALSNPIYVRTP